MEGAEVAMMEMNAEATWKVMENLLKHGKYNIVTRNAMENAVRLLKEQEAKWVEDKQGEICRLIKCSNCGLTFIVGNNIPYDEWIEDKNYCRRCGARMVKRND